MNAPLPFCSIIIPCRDEAEFIGQCLDSLTASDYPADRRELIVVDGMSTDGTRAIVERYAAKGAPVRLVDNPLRVTPAALNIGVRVAQGSVILRMDAHAEYPRDYVSQCVRHLAESGADNVGGVIRTVPRTTDLVGQAVALVLSHRMGVGNSAFRTGSNEPVWTDTVFGGCYRREVFDRIGLWNEQLTRGQDIEFNLRLGAAGGRTLLVPDIVCSYSARSDFWTFVRHNFRNGVWAIVPFAYSSIMPVRFRHLVPALSLTGILALGALALVAPVAGWVAAAAFAAYAIAILGTSIQLAVRERRLSLALVLPAVFAALHFPYAVGSLWGVVRVAGISMRRAFGRLTGRGSPASSAL